MTVVVCGGTGFMGGAAVRHLLRTQQSVRILTRSASRARSVVARWPEGPEALASNRVTFVEGDVTEPASLPRALVGARVVIQATQFPGAPVEDPRRGYTYMHVDRGGTINLLAALRHVADQREATGDAASTDAAASSRGPAAAGVAASAAGAASAPAPTTAPHVIYLSGVGVTSGGDFPWIRAKLEAEQAVRESPFPWTIVRSSWAYGPGDRSLNRLLGYARRLPFLPFFGDGRERVTPVFVEDVGRLLAAVAAAPQGAAGLILPLGGPDEVSLNEMLRIALEIAGLRRPILHVPLALGRAMGAVAQYLPGRPLTPGAVDFVAHGGVADPAPLRRAFPDFTTTPLRTALATYLGASRTHDPSLKAGASNR